MTTEKNYKIEQVAEILQVSLITVYRLVYSGKLKSFKIGRNHRIKESELNKYIEEQSKGV